MADSERSPSLGHYNRGAEEFKKKNYDESIRRFKMAVDIDPKFYRAWAYLAMAYAAAGKLDEAIEAYRKCIDVEPSYHKAYNNIGELYRRKGLLDYAAMVFKMATEIDATHAHYFYNLGITYFDIGMLPQAEEALAQAHAKEPGDFDYASDLAQVRYNLKKFDAAVQAVMEFLKAAPEHDRAIEMKARLKMLVRRAEEEKKAAATAPPPEPKKSTTRIEPIEPVA
jgi:tetratricopeptide (TPR) repeat protein